MKIGGNKEEKELMGMFLTFVHFRIILTPSKKIINSVTAERKI